MINMKLTMSETEMDWRKERYLKKTKHLWASDFRARATFRGGSSGPPSCSKSPNVSAMFESGQLFYEMHAVQIRTHMSKSYDSY